MIRKYELTVRSYIIDLDSLTADMHLVIKSLVLNSLSLVSIYAFDWVILPLLHKRRSPDSLTNTYSTYQLLWLFPVVGVSLYLNVRALPTSSQTSSTVIQSSWCALIGRQAYGARFGRQHATSPTTYTGYVQSPTEGVL